MIFDTHAHYTDERYDDDRDSVLSSMPENNVGLIMNVSSQLSEMPDILKLADKYPFIYAAVGIHPEAVLTATDGYLDLIKEYAKHPKIKAIGEIGLDYYWTTDTKEMQQRILGEQIDLARELKLPVVIHDREAHADTLRILKEHKVYECGGVLHCYSGSAQMAEQIVNELDMYIAFGGTVTFKNAIKPKEAAKVVPLDRLLIETDAPYLAPVPYRGERNTSAYLTEVLKEISALRGIDVDELEKITEENGRRLFGI